MAAQLWNKRGGKLFGETALAKATIYNLAFPIITEKFPPTSLTQMEKEDAPARTFRDALVFTHFKSVPQPCADSVVRS